MPRNRIIYQSEALYVGPSPATGNHFSLGNSGVNFVDQLQRVQTANYSFTVDRTDVNQFGQLAAIDRVILTSPTVSLDFSYILANLANETGLGLTVSTAGSTSAVSAISGILNKTQDEKNYFIRTTPEGTDAVGNSVTGSTIGVIGIGNGFMTSYSTEASVGNFPTATVNVEGLNMTFQQGTTGNYIPAINPSLGTAITGTLYALDIASQNSAGSANATGISALRPGDITLSLPSIPGADSSTFNIQSYTLSFDLARTPIEKLGSKFAFAREIDFPLTVSLSVDAQVTDMTSGTLANLVANDSTTFYNPIVTIKSPLDSAVTVAQFDLRRAKLDSQEFSSDVGSNKSVTLNFSSQVGGPEDKANGLFISGVY
jgi:hypothetical protein